VNVHECDTQLKVPYYTIFTSDPEEPFLLFHSAIQQFLVLKNGAENCDKKCQVLLDWYAIERASGI
jgi:hypothetical protein